MYKIETVETMPASVRGRRSKGVFSEQNSIIKNAIDNMNGKPISIRLESAKQKNNVTQFIYGLQTENHKYSCFFDKDTLKLYIQKIEREQNG